MVLRSILRAIFPAAKTDFNLPRRDHMLKLRLVSLAALCFLSSALVFGQAVNGRIDGSIKDPTGAIVPGATVVIQNIATGIARSAQGAVDGAFSFAEVAPGTY